MLPFCGTVAQTHQCDTEAGAWPGGGQNPRGAPFLICAAESFQFALAICSAAFGGLAHGSIHHSLTGSPLHQAHLKRLLEMYLTPAPHTGFDLLPLILDIQPKIWCLGIHRHRYPITYYRWGFNKIQKEVPRLLLLLRRTTNGLATIRPRRPGLGTTGH